MAVLMHWSEAYFADGQRPRQESVTCAPASGGQALTGSFSLVRTVSYLTARTVAHGFGTGRCGGSRLAQEGGVRWNAAVAGAARPAGLPRTRSSGDLFGVTPARLSLRRRLTLGGECGSVRSCTVSAGVVVRQLANVPLSGRPFRADRLVGLGIERVVMEATSDYVRREGA
jgi:hypothetical protein